LYAGTYPSGKILRSANGTDWTEVEDTSEEYTYSLAVFDGYLYAGTGNIGKIFRSANGTDWTEVENTSESFIYSLTVFDGYLYAGTGTNGKILRSANGTDWTEVENTSESFIYSLTVFDGYLYAGTGTNGKILRMNVANGAGAVESVKAAIATDAETMLCAVYDGDDLLLYQDGVEVASESLSGVVAANALNLIIGSGYGTIASGFGGLGESNAACNIKSCMVFSSALTPTQISKLHTILSARYE
jgi:hypothetical protein